MGPFNFIKYGDMPIKGKKYTPLVIKEGFQSKKKSYGWQKSIKGHIVDDKNLMLFQSDMECKDVLTKSEYFIHKKEDSIYRCNSEAKGIEFQFCLEGEANFEIKQSSKAEYSWRFVRAGRHNMQTFNGFTNDVRIHNKGPLVILNIEITKERLLELADRYSILTPMVQAVNDGKNSLLFQAPRISTSEMHLLICEIFELEHQPVRNQDSINLLIDQLIVCFLEYKQEGHISYSFSQTEKFYKASQYLKEHFKQSKC